MAKTLIDTTVFYESKTLIANVLLPFIMIGVNALGVTLTDVEGVAIIAVINIILRIITSSKIVLNK